jgi:hypothetical protein
VSVLAAYGEQVMYRYRWEMARPKSHHLDSRKPERALHTTLLANMLLCLSRVEAEGTEAAYFFVFAGERQHAGNMQVH